MTSLYCYLAKLRAKWVDWLETIKISFALAEDEKGKENGR